MNAINWVKGRLSEPSTHSAIGGAAAMLYFSNIIPGPYNQILYWIGVSFFGTAFALPEKK